jgi:hypothetical protein
MYLGYVISWKGLSMDLKKVESTTDWPIPHNVCKVVSFHGIANFYRKFIRGFNGFFAFMAESMKRYEFKWNVM